MFSEEKQLNTKHTKSFFLKQQYTKYGTNRCESTRESKEHTDGLYKRTLVLLGSFCVLDTVIQNRASNRNNTYQTGNMNLVEHATSAI